MISDKAGVSAALDPEAKIAALEAELAALKRAKIEPQFDGEAPRYRLLKPFYGPDDRYYDPEEGDEIIDWDGVPNEQMEPINDPAKMRMTAYLERLPAGKTPALADIVQAAASLRPKYGDEEIPLEEFAGEVLKQALRIDRQRRGEPVEERKIVLPEKPKQVAVTGDKAMKPRRGRPPKHLKAIPQEKPDTRPKPQVLGEMNQSNTF